MVYSAGIMTCPACGSEAPDTARFCPTCGGAIDLEASPTIDAELNPRKPSPSPSGRRSSFSGYEARYVPGTTLADRYRIVSPLGKGGMGEVYRAEDLKLGQTVALKFLPSSLAQTGESLERFTREVRLARQVSHPSVCRVFDIGEIMETTPAGKPITHTFLTMEFVDGEDLGSLLRRIGRLPTDKALEIARQICAGLAAAHEHGIIHRDLKPANVMLDGRGRVRITDFGLAGLAAEIERDDAHAGTPAYMSPEQFEGKGVTPKSDIYSVGLVLYEIFTGKRPFSAASSEEMARLRDKSAPPSPSEFVKDLDPLIERVILRCLEKDPSKRPASALQIAAALPGGDPLAAALAAGETPSPEMVAASGISEGLRPAMAWGLLAAVVLSASAAILLGSRTMLYSLVPLETPPDALALRAQDILKNLGYSEPPVDTAVGLYENSDFLNYIEEHDNSKTRWDNLENGAFLFWYRSSLQPLAGRDVFSRSQVFESVWTDDPPLNLSGMTLVQLTPSGRLSQFVVVPPQVEESIGASSSPDWTPLFSAAGLDPSKWTPVPPMWTPPVYSDARAAWRGMLAGRPLIPMRIEAAAYRGKPVYFELIGPWTQPERMQPSQLSGGVRVGLTIFIILLVSMLGFGAMVAWRNLRLGRGDRRGAFRLAAFVFVAWGGAWLSGAHHVATYAELLLILEFLVWAIAWASFFWVLYIAMEPYVRRRWPATLISWSRLLAGGFRDPLVGRDVLLGCLFGALVTVYIRLEWFVPVGLGHPPPQPFFGPNYQFLGTQSVICSISFHLIFSTLLALAFLFVLFLFRALLRKEWAAGLGFIVFFTVFLSAPTFRPDSIIWLILLRGVVLNFMTIILLRRIGLMAGAAGLFFQSCFLADFPITTHGSLWYAGLSLSAILMMAALVIFAFYTSLGGRPVFGGAVLDD